MLFYAVYASADGELVSMGWADDDVLPTLAPGFALTQYATMPDRDRMVWDTVQRTFVPRPPVQRAVLTPDEFWDRLTNAELVAIEQAGWASTQAAAQVRAAVKVLERAEVLDVALPRIRAALQVFVTRSLLTAQRLNEITTPVTEP